VGAYFATSRVHQLPVQPCLRVSGADDAQQGEFISVRMTLIPRASAPAMNSSSFSRYQSE
jgi:hypothetical protein